VGRLSSRAALEARVRAGQKGLVPYLTAGFPDWDRFDAAVHTLAENGADVLELGIPFSDPLADGPTIQRSSQLALEAGVTLEAILEHVARNSEAWGIPIVFMTYLNPILAYGVERFCDDAVEAGVSGLLLSDLPPEELPELWQSLQKSKIETTLLVAPTTVPERAKYLAQTATGFVYCISRTGVTGQGSGYAANLTEQVALVRAATSLPALVGFGIRSAEDAKRIGPIADGVVIGARLIELLSDAPTPAVAKSRLAEFTRGVRQSLDSLSAASTGTSTSQEPPS